MSDLCSCCGDKIAFLEADFDYVHLEKKTYKICKKCRNKINLYNAGNISLEEVICSKTNDKIADYIRNIASQQEDKGQEKELLENGVDVQQLNLFYNDVHQIAGDLRFIKNLTIIGIVLSVILCLLPLMGM